MRVVTRQAAIGLALAWLASPLPTAAEQDEQQAPTLAESVEQPTGTAEVGFGWLILPGAEVCVEREGPCPRGDSSLTLEAWQVFRLSSAFAAGAGLMLGVTPTTDAPLQEPEGIERDHTRRYLTVEAMARYYPYVGDTFEVWAGLTSGLVVVSDTFATRAQHSTDRALVGPRGSIIRTEGFILGIAGGVAYEFAPSWLLGGNLRYANWFLPGEPQTSPLGDEASLVGRNSVIIIGLNIAYRISL